MSTQELTDDQIRAIRLKTEYAGTPAEPKFHHSVHARFVEFARAVIADDRALRSNNKAQSVGWKPLETAPDGVRVLLGPRDAPVVGIVKHKPHWAEEQEPISRVVHYNGVTLVSNYHCSEWMPLPGVAQPNHAALLKAAKQALKINEQIENALTRRRIARAEAILWLEEGSQLLEAMRANATVLRAAIKESE